MNRSLSLIAAIAALALAGSAQAQPAPGAEPSTLPSTDPGMPSTDAATTAQSSLSAASQNTRLAAIVPAGMSTQEACAGFRSTDECAATLHASQNLRISFTDLKAKVTGGQKLGAAIKELKPDANVKAEVRKAEDQARADARSPQG